MESVSMMLKTALLLSIFSLSLAFPAKDEDRKLEHVIRQVIAHRNSLGPGAAATPAERSALIAQIMDIARANSQKRNNTPVAYAGIGGGNAGRRLFRGRRGGFSEMDLKLRLQILGEELQAIARDIDVAMGARQK